MGEHGEWSQTLAREAQGEDFYLLNRDELWAIADKASKLGYQQVKIDILTYCKLVAAYDYWLVETGRYIVVSDEELNALGELVDGSFVNYDRWHPMPDDF